jgi:hypothetical protein
LKGRRGLQLTVRWGKCRLWKLLRRRRGKCCFGEWLYRILIHSRCGSIAVRIRIFVIKYEDSNGTQVGASGEFQLDVDERHFDICWGSESRVRKRGRKKQSLLPLTKNITCSKGRCQFPF